MPTGAKPQWWDEPGDVPATFNKLLPGDGATEQPLSGLKLKWASSNGMTPPTSYEYCYDTTDDDACSSWIDNGMETSKTLSPLSPLTTYYWHVRAINGFGTTYSNGDEWLSFTTKSTTTTPPYHSTAANDGWLLESTEFSNLANTKSNSGTLRVGDDAKNKQYRSLLYFDASLPNDAVLYKVIVKIKKAAMAGTDPFTTHGNLVADVKKGSFGLSPLELTDFNAAGAPISSAGSFSDIGGGWYQLTLSPANFKYINLGGVTQFRLRFTKDDDNDKKADYISFYAGDAASTDRPQLIVEYYVP